MDSKERAAAHANIFEAKKEKIEERHRAEILNLLKSFEFERKDMESRFRAEWERRELENDGGDEKGISNNILDEMREEQEKENGELKLQYEKEKEDLTVRIRKLEEEVAVQRQIDQNDRGDNFVSRGFSVSEEDGFEQQKMVEGDFSVQDSQSFAKDVCQTKIDVSVKGSDSACDSEFQTNHAISRVGENHVKSLSELEKDNKKLLDELNSQLCLVGKLQGQVDHLNNKLAEIQDLFKDDDVIPVHKKDRLRDIFEDCPRELPGRSSDIRKRSSSEEYLSVFPASGDNRSHSEMSFRLEELNLENDELKSNVHKLERKIKRTIEEYEIQRSFLKEKLDGILERLVGKSHKEDKSSELSGLDKTVLEDTVKELRHIKLEMTSKELLEDYVRIMLCQQTGTQSPDEHDVNIRHEIQSLERLLDIEIFDGRVFDEEMKDEVDQVLRDKARELMIAYAVEKLRDEIRHRLATQTVLEELRCEREKDFCVNQVVVEVLRGQLGISTDVGDHGKELKNELLEFSQGKPKTELEKGEKDLSLNDMEALEAEKKELERSLGELQEHFQNERQNWSEKLQSSLQKDKRGVDNKNMVIQRYFAEKDVIEQVVNLERFQLSRLYYMEMKEELELSLQECNFKQNGKLVKERIKETWLHHVEIGELYEDILDKETESVEKMKRDVQDEESRQEKFSQTSSEGELGKEVMRLQFQLPLKLELVEVQRKRCRDHKKATLILEQAVNAVETAVHERDTLLVSSDFLKRNSSWASSEDEGLHSEGLELSPLFPSSSGSRSTAKGTEAEEGQDLFQGNINSKETLRKALAGLLEELLNEQSGMEDSQPDSYTSESELSESETSKNDPTSRDEAVVKKSPAVNDVLSGNNSPEEHASDIDTEKKREKDSETNVAVSTPSIDSSETDDASPESSVPKVFKLPPQIENILNIERFNLSRLLNDEYADKIRRGRRKLRHVEKQNSESSGEVLRKFQERLDLLLERTDFGEKGAGIDEVSGKQRKLTSTSSNDSGIGDFSDQDKDGVVRKYKELLEKARRDLNRAHKVLRYRRGKVEGNGVDEELDNMTRNLKERRSDIQEIEDKHSELDRERQALLGKIRDAGDAVNKVSADSSVNLPGDQREEALKERDSRAQLSASDDLADQQLSEKRLEMGEAAADKVTRIGRASSVGEQFFENKEGKSLDEQVSVKENSYIEAGGVNMDYGGLVNENEELEKRVDNLVMEIERKGKEFYDENEKKQKEIEELQRKLVDGTGDEGILLELQEKLKEANDEKKALEVKLSELKKSDKPERLGKADQNEGKTKTEFENLEKENKMLDDDNKFLREKVDELQAKILEGTDGEDVLRDLQHEVKSLYEKNKVLEKKNKELEEEEICEIKENLPGDDMAKVVASLEQENKKLALENEEMTRQVEKLQKGLFEGTGREEILEQLQEKIKDLNAKNKDLGRKCRTLEEIVNVSPNPTRKSVKELEKELDDVNKKKEELTLERRNKENEIARLQRQLVEGSGSEELLKDLQNQIRTLKENNESLKIRCKDLEDMNDQLKAEKEERGGILQRKMSENAKLVREIKSKDEEVCGLQKALVEGSGGDEILKTLQDHKRALEERNQLLAKQSENLRDINEGLKENLTDVNGRNIETVNELAKMKENDYLEQERQAKSDEISKLQKKLMDGNGGGEILEDLHGRVKELEEMNKEMRMKCNELEARNETLKRDRDEVGDGKEKELFRLRSENERLRSENSSKEIEISDLQKKLVEGSGGEEMLEEIQKQLKKFKQKTEQLESECYGVEKENEDLRGCKRRLTDENASLVDEIEAKHNEVRDLQGKLVDGTGGEAVLQDLQKEAGVLKKKCTLLKEQSKDLESANETLGKREEELKTENEEKAKELSRLRKENDYLERESRAKTDEILKLQEKLLDGTGQEDVLKELQDRVKDLEEINKELRRKCKEMEARKETSKGVGDKAIDEGEMAFYRLSGENEKLQDDVKNKELEISDLQKRLVEGSGGEDVLVEIKGQLKRLKERNELLKAECCDIENENSKLRYDKRNLSEENACLVDDNEAKDIEIHELQMKLVDGTGGGEILQSLQNQVGKLEKDNKMLKKQCRDLKNVIDTTGKDEERLKMKIEELEKELARMRKENDFIEMESQNKSDELCRLQAKLLQGTDGEEILQELPCQMKELEEMKKESRNKCNEMEAGEKTLKEHGHDGKDYAKEFVELKKENERLQNENGDKEKEIFDLQEKLFSGSGQKKILLGLQDEIRKLRDSSELLGTECRDLKDANEKLTVEAGKRKEAKGELSRLENENRRLVDENDKQSSEICDLQRKLVDGTGTEEILQHLQEELRSLKEKTRELEKQSEEFEHQKVEKKGGVVCGTSGLVRDSYNQSKDRNGQANSGNKQLRACYDQLGDSNGLVNTSTKQLTDDNEQLGVSSNQQEDRKGQLRHSDEQMRDDKGHSEQTKGSKTGEINRVRRGLIRESDGGDNVQELDRDEKLEKRSEELRKARNDQLNSEEMTKQGDGSMREVAKLRSIAEKLKKENQSVSDGIVKLQERLPSGTGRNEMLAELRDKVNNLRKENDELLACCQEFEERIGIGNDGDKQAEGAVEDSRDSEMDRELKKLKKEAGVLKLDQKNKEREIIDLQKKLLEGTGAEEVLLQLQDRLKDFEEKMKDLESQCSELRDENEKLKRISGDKQWNKSDFSGKNASLGSQIRINGEPKSLKRDDIGFSKETRRGEDGGSPAVKFGPGFDKAGSIKGDIHFGTNKNKSAPREEFMGVKTSGGDGMAFVPEEFAEKTSHEECPNMIPTISEERDHWREKYQALRKKVGAQFVDIIPEVWSEEAELEKEIDETLSRLSEVKAEIGEREDTLLETMYESERIERELVTVWDQLEDNMEQLRYLRDLEDQEGEITEEESRLMERLAELESDSDGGVQNQDLSLEEGDNKDRKVDDKNDTVKKKDVINLLHQEMEQILTAQERLENERKDGILSLVNEKVEIEEEMRKLDLAIEELLLDSTATSYARQSSNVVSRNVEAEEMTMSQTLAVEDELENIRSEIDKLQSSLVSCSSSNERDDVGSLVGLMKEKSRLEDELSGAEKTLGQLGKRDYENLLKERAKQRKVAKKLLELSREKDVVLGEFQEMETLVKAKEGDLLSCYNSKRDRRESVRGLSEEEGRRFTGETSGVRKTSADSGEIEGKEESTTDIKEEGVVSSEAVANMAEEFGVMLEKKSSLGARLESLGKEITAQSYKVEKSLLGVKDDPAGEMSPTGEMTPGSSYSSLEDLSQSQLSIFDDYNMVDELSLATNVVRDERMKRKSSRKAPLSKLLKERSGLESKVKQLEGKVLVQNAKVRNALREAKDATKAKEKFIRAVGERNEIEKELANVIAKIDESELQGDESFSRGKLGRRRRSTGSLERKGRPSGEKKGKSLSKNDKRRLLSQRESLSKQLEAVKRKIEGFSLGGEEEDLEDFPEMAEVGTTGNIRKMVGRLRELVSREVELGQNLDEKVLNEELFEEEDLKDVVTLSRPSGVSAPQQAGSGESVKIVERGRTLKDSGEGALSDDDELQRRPSSYPRAVKVLRREKERKLARLRELEDDMIRKKSSDKVEVEKVKQDLRVKRKELKNKMKAALEGLKLEKQTLGALRDSVVTKDETTEDKEARLNNDILVLRKQKEELEKKLLEANESVKKQTAKSGQDLVEVYKEYGKLLELKSEEEKLERIVENINKKLVTRKEWYTADTHQEFRKEEEGDGNRAVAQSYEHILERMSQENLNMADLIRELEVTQETLSKEREITGELLDLIKSRVGNELLEALTGDGFSSPPVTPLVGTAEMHTVGSARYQELASKVEHDNVTVAEIIADYKRKNEDWQRENQKLLDMLGLLKLKVDEDLFDSIVNQEPVDVEVSKKLEISKILENNKTLFGQIITLGNDEERKLSEKRMKSLEDEMEKLEMELEDNGILNEQNKKMKNELIGLGEKMESVSTKLDDIKKERDALKRNAKDSEELNGKHASPKGMFGGLENEDILMKDKTGEVDNQRDEAKNDAELTEEDKNKVMEEILKGQIGELGSTLKEVDEEKEELGSKVAAVKRSFDEKLAAVKDEKNEVVLRLEQAEKLNDQMKEELKKQQQVKNENEILREKVVALENRSKDIFEKLEKAEAMKNVKSKKIGEASRCLEELRDENSSMKATIEELEKQNKEIIPSMHELKKTNKKMQDEIEYLRKEERDFESLREKLRDTEFEGKRLMEELEELNSDKEKLDSYVKNILQRDITGGLQTALQEYNKDFQDMADKCCCLTRECESFEELQKIVGKSLAERLLGLTKKQTNALKDTRPVPKCVESISERQVTLAYVLEDYEEKLNMTEQRLGRELFRCISDGEYLLESGEGQKDLKVLKELKDGKDLTQIVKNYEDLIDSQAENLLTAKENVQKVQMLEVKLKDHREHDKRFGKRSTDGWDEKNAEQGAVCKDDGGENSPQTKLSNKDGERNRIFKDVRGEERPPLSFQLHESHEVDDDSGDERGTKRQANKLGHGSKKDDQTIESTSVLYGDHEKKMDSENHGTILFSMEEEYQELLKKVMGHEQEIREAEELLREQREKHEQERKELVKQLNDEKTSMQHQIEHDRKSMDKAIQSLINEIVRLKEERKDIRKSHRLEREKLEAAFENERAELHSSNEKVRAEIQDKLEKTVREVSLKEKAMMDEREKELKEEINQLKNEKKQMVDKVRNLENRIENELGADKDSDRFLDTKWKDTRKEIENELQQKSKEEKEKFQETLVSLRKEVERLQLERSRILSEISERNVETLRLQAADYSERELSVYRKLESEFKAKMNSEKIASENRIRELRDDKEELNKQKRVMSVKMRKQKLEINSLHEKEKKELVEKHRNEMKALRNKVQEKARQNLERSTMPRTVPHSQAFYELQRAVREKDAKIRRYEIFFRELNKEASIFQQDQHVAA